MSTWTHVCGSVRIDDMSFLKQKRNQIKDVEKILGKMCTWNNWYDKCKLPMGSEGSIEYKVIQNTDEDSLARFDILIYGDLRDYDDLEEIKNWFISLKEKFENNESFMCIRDAVLKCYCETGEVDNLKIIIYNAEKSEFEEVKL